MKIIFVGTTNAMPMGYALRLRSKGFDVEYIVDVPKANALSRPEFHYDEIHYPYPEWIKERIVRIPSFKTLLPAFFFKKILSEITSADIYFLCDWYISLAPFLPKKAKIIILPHGADLDTWCDLNKANDISRVGRYSIFWPIKKIIALIIINNMRKGLLRADAITYYPAGLNRSGDAVVEEFRRINNKVIVRRYDVNFSSAAKFKGQFKVRNGPLRLCSAVRFDYVEQKDVKNEYLKGCDIIIKGVAKFYKEYSKDIEIIFFNKGCDVEAAKELCIKENIDNVVTWRDSVPFKELLKIIDGSDICFDQVGRHWVGAVGAFSLYLGKPLIANYRPDVLDAFFVGNNPICQAQSVDDVFNHLVKLDNETIRREISIKCREFAVTNFSIDGALSSYLGIIESQVNIINSLT